MSESDHLKGVCVLVTRPRGRGESLCDAVTSRGGVAERLPLLEIEAVTPGEALSAVLDGIKAFDTAIFVSVNAVEHGLALLAQRGISLRPGTLVAAVGRASAEALARHGIAGAVFPPGRSSSEELLECEVFKRPAGRRVVIFRGQDGRELLADTLARRGAEVHYAAVYRRVPAGNDIAPAVARWLDAARPVLVLTSEAAARVLLRRLPSSLRAAALAAPVVVPSERLARFCREGGWRGAVGVSDTPGDEDLLAAVSDVSRATTN